MIKQLTSRVSLVTGIWALLCAAMFWAGYLSKGIQWPDFILHIAGWFWPSMMNSALAAIVFGVISLRLHPSRMATVGVALGSIVFAILVMFIVVRFTFALR